jgi:hypothetical protein
VIFIALVLGLALVLAASLYMSLYTSEGGKGRASSIASLPST